MTDSEKREGARRFYQKWVGRGEEDKDDRSYWLDILQRVLGAADATDRVDFQKSVVVNGNSKRIDGYIRETSVIIEQKSLGIPLDKKIHQSDGTDLTPYEQAKRYNDNLPRSEKARWIVTSNFAEIWIYDMEATVPEKSVIKLTIADLQNQYSLLDFLLKKEVKKITKETELSLKAGELVGKIYSAFQKQYNDPTAKKSLESLNILCVRLVFCLYAEDAGLFENKDSFTSYLSQYEPKDMRTALINLFKVLDTPDSERPDMYFEDELLAFPYVNGGLFAKEDIVIPKLTQEIKDTILEASGFNWSEISPTIFGAVFESTLNPVTRRSGGMHYTSIENIHKLIDPLFLDDLKAELKGIKEITVKKTRNSKLEAFQDKLSKLKFLDPACGSGNFLTETYVSLRRLENEILSTLWEEQMGFGDNALNPIKVSISQFFGIEINDFAVTVAKTALWIAESQMMKETETIVLMHLDFLPLKTNAYIVEGNALQVDWKEVVSPHDLTYIMGNPPFIGASMMSKEQKSEAVAIFGKGKRVNSIDYVGAWYYKAAAYIQETNILAAFVSTNSITQGEQVAPLWEKLFKTYKIHLDFAYKTFKWSSEASEKAAVHCVIIGFSCCKNSKKKNLYEGVERREAENISPYLIDAPNVFIESRGSSLCDAPRMTAGNKPSDGGNLILSEEERDNLLKKDPSVAVCVRRYVGSKDFINSDEIRYCLWLKDISPTVYYKNAEIMRRLDAVKEMRLASSAAPTRALADRPYIFFSTPQTDSNYLCIPEVSSERRRYIPIGFMDKSIIASNKLLIVPDATLYHFGVLTSNVHMAWVRTVCGRLKSDYQYSGATVYNNFPWPTPTDDQKGKIEKTAQMILDARAKYPDRSLAMLYDPRLMPKELSKAHQANDRAVMEAYGLNVGETSEESCAAFLLKRYQELSSGKKEK